jgi:hypothetical protein
MTSEKQTGGTGGRPGDPAHDSPKRQGDKLERALGPRGGATPPPEDPAGAPTHDSPKRHGDKLEKARDAAAGQSKSKPK